MVVPSRRGGVPVLSLPRGKPNRASVAASPTEGGSTSSESRRWRPPAYRSFPIRRTPRRKVPVVMTTVRAEISPLVPSGLVMTTPRMRARRWEALAAALARAAIRRSASDRSANSVAPVSTDNPARVSIPSPSSSSKSSTLASTVVSVRSSPSSSLLPLQLPSRIRSCIAAWYRSRSICPRGPLTAGPFLLLSIRKCTPARSAASPIIPPSASTSFTKWPLPMPPIDGLHDNSPMVSTRWVMRAVRAPVRAEDVAASQPACPPPTIMTS